MRDFFFTFLSNIKKNNLIKKGDHVIAGFSGGKDSTALLHLLLMLKDKIAIKLSAAYLNHNIREDADEESNHVYRHCKEFGIPLNSAKFDIPQFAKSRGMNLEAAASLKRYEFFSDVSAQFRNSKIATAHTKSDTAETFLMKLMRGSGGTGLSSIYERKKPNIIRPLLIFNSEQILDFLDKEGLSYYSDPSNSDARFLRNRIRNKILPELKKVDKYLEEHIFSTAKILEKESDYFRVEANKILGKELVLGKILKSRIIMDSHEAMAASIIREYIRKLKGNLFNISYDHINLFREMTISEKSFSIPGINFRVKKGYVYPEKFTIRDYCHFSRGESNLVVNEIHKTISFSTVKKFKKPSDNQSIILKRSSLILPLKISNPQKNMTYRKLNSKFSQPVSEVISGAGIPWDLKNMTPVISNGNGEIIWIYGCPVSEKYKISKQQEKYKDFLLIKISDT